ncbi:MAG: DMT family transporter [Sphaerospermopsis sp. SIO1G2]|nr:DMT family transporter [Sphaerospermopsis sp. SIO1G1]NET70744.1 DMT family transporter [Sphaerospermopsis sp. SIO1G2]
MVLTIKKGELVIFNIFSNIPLNLAGGEIAALSAACLWAIASVVYGILGKSIPPLQLNLIKGVIAISFLLITIVMTGDFSPSLAPVPLLLILLSGAVGIGLGDTIFFAALNQLGPRKVLLIETLSPPMSAIAASIFLDEFLTLGAWCGILLTILGIAWVVTERVSHSSDNSKTQTWKGISLGILAAAANSSGAILSRAAFSQINISPLWAGLLRLTAGFFIILVWVLISPQNSHVFVNILQLSKRVLCYCILAAFLGTYLTIWLQQTAIKLTNVGIAATLIQTSPIFIIPIAILMGEKVSLRAILGVIVAIVGISLLF